MDDLVPANTRPPIACRTVCKVDVLVALEALLVIADRDKAVVVEREPLNNLLAEARAKTLRRADLGIVSERDPENNKDIDNNGFLEFDNTREASTDTDISKLDNRGSESTLEVANRMESESNGLLTFEATREPEGDSRKSAEPTLGRLTRRLATVDISEARSVERAEAYSLVVDITRDND